MARKSLPSVGALGQYRLEFQSKVCRREGARPSRGCEESEGDDQVSSDRNQREGAARRDALLLVLRGDARGALLQLLR